MALKINLAKVRNGAVDRQGNNLDLYINYEFHAKFYKKYAFLSHPKLKECFEVEYKYLITYTKTLD